MHHRKVMWMNFGYGSKFEQQARSVCMMWIFINYLYVPTLHCVCAHVAIATMLRPKNEWTKKPQMKAETHAHVCTHSIAFSFRLKISKQTNQMKSEKNSYITIESSTNSIGPTRTHKSKEKQRERLAAYIQNNTIKLTFVASRHCRHFWSWINFLCKKFAQLITIDTRFLIRFCYFKCCFCVQFKLILYHKRYENECIK